MKRRSAREVAAAVGDPRPTAVNRVLASIASRLDRDGPIPVYHQLAEHLRWEIGVGRIGLGATLPPARDVALSVGVNYHTVRRAYGELRRRGILESTRRRGTSVLGRAAIPAHRGKMRHVTVVECNLTQASQIAGELAGLGLAASGWLLGWPDPPPGELVTTPFHVGEVRRRWSGRTIRVVPLRTHPDLADSILARARSQSLQRVVLVEQDRSTAHSMLADVRAALAGSGLKLSAIATTKPSEVIARHPDALVLFAPRVFDGLSWSVQSHPRVSEARFTIGIATAAELLGASDGKRKGRS